jgi:small subunit ribosomal protein S5
MSQPSKGGGRGKFKQKREKPEFDQHIVDLARVTRVTEGGKHMSFRACVVIGDRKGRVGFGVDKGPDVQIAVEKAVNQAKKNIIRIPIINETIPHRVEAKYKAAKVMLKPAPQGSGVIAGSAIRVILEMAGVPNASSKMLGKTSNKIANVKAVFEALEKFSARAREVYSKKDIQPEQVVVGEPAVKEEETAAPAKTPRKKAPVKA